MTAILKGSILLSDRKKDFLTTAYMSRSQFPGMMLFSRDDLNTNCIFYMGSGAMRSVKTFLSCPGIKYRHQPLITFLFALKTLILRPAEQDISVTKGSFSKCLKTSISIIGQIILR